MRVEGEDGNEDEVKVKLRVEMKRRSSDGVHTGSGLVQVVPNRYNLSGKIRA